MHVKKSTLVFYFLFWSCYTFLLPRCDSESNEHSVNLFKKVVNGEARLQPIGQHAELTIGKFKRVKSRGLIRTLEGLKVENLALKGKRKIQDVIYAVEDLTVGGGTELYTFQYSDAQTKLEFVTIAIQLVDNSIKAGPIFNYAICSLNFKQPPKMEPVYAFDNWLVQWWKINETAVNTTITDETKTDVEVYFMHELYQRGEAGISPSGTFKLFPSSS